MATRHLLLLLVPGAAPPSSAARSAWSGISAARWTTRWMRRRIRRPPRSRWRSGATEVGRLFGAEHAADAAGREPASRVVAQFCAVAAAVRRSGRRRRDGPRPIALRDLRRAGRVLPARGLGRRPDLHRDLRLPRSAVARLRVNLGLALQLTNIIRDVAVDLAQRPRLPAAGGSRAVRRDREATCAPAR